MGMALITYGAFYPLLRLLVITLTACSLISLSVFALSLKSKIFTFITPWTFFVSTFNLIAILFYGVGIFDSWLPDWLLLDTTILERSSTLLEPLSLTPSEPQSLTTNSKIPAHQLLPIKKRWGWLIFGWVCMTTGTVIFYSLFFS
jgi:hypothetical protein